MCVVDLNVTTQPCEHRWYALRKACQPSHNLANCTAKVQLQGWENRSPECPWCANETATALATTHRLLGSSSTAATAIAPIPRSKRSGSNGTLESLSRTSSMSSVDSDRGQKHRDMNERLDLYLRLHPHELLPSAKKNYPTYCQAASNTACADDASELTLIRRSSSGLSRQFRKSVRFGRDMFRS